jgi:hypothetical protein
MAGEWIAVDIGLPEKPETQEVVDLTGQSVEVVCFRLYRLWGWASLNTADGTARMTIPRLARTCGGDEAFWEAVEAVGWLIVDREAATITIPAWDRRFSQAAKARLQKADRSAAYEARNPSRRPGAGSSGAQAPDTPALTRRRGEERRGEIPPPPHACEDGEPDPASWATLRDAWQAGPGVPHRSPQPPDEALARLAEPGWLGDALAAIGRLGACRYFKTPVGLPQFCGERFVARVLQGRYDDLTERPSRGGQRTPADDRRSAAQSAADWDRSAADPEARKRREEFLAAKAKKACRPQDTGIEEPQAFTGPEASAFEATKRRLADQLRAQEGAA